MKILWTPISKDGLVKKGIDEKMREYMMSRDGAISRKVNGYFVQLAAKQLKEIER